MPLPSNESSITGSSSETREFGVSIILIPHNNQERLTTRLTRDVLPTIAAHPDWKFQLIVVDNSDPDKRPAYDLDGYDILHSRLDPGSNIMYGPAMNMALRSCAYPFVVYVCSNHGRMYDPSWIDDLLSPLADNPKAAMTGTAYPSCPPGDMGFPQHLPHYHIQGGVFAARTTAMLDNPYTDDERWKHWGSDVYQSFLLLQAGFELVDVPSVRSVWRQCVDAPERWKFVHDYSEG